MRAPAAGSEQDTERDFSIDALRAVAILCIVGGHWIVTGIRLKYGVLSIVSPLQYAPRLSPYTFVFQALALFFFAAGYGAATRRSDPPVRAVRRAVSLARQLLAPLGVLALLWLAFGLTMFLLGLPLTNVAPIGSLLIDPLWFFAVYLLLTLLHPWIQRLDEVIGWWTVAIAVALVALGDVNSYLGPHLPGTIVLSEVGAWTIPYVLGLRLRRADEGGRSLSAWIVLAAGLAGLTAALLLGPYPLSMVGVTGAPHSNLNPPSLATVSLGLTQVGLFLVLRPVIRRMAWRWTRWLVGLLNHFALQIYLLLQTALLLPILVSAASVPIPGLIANEIGPFWMPLRAAAFPVFALVLVLLIWGLFGRPGGQESLPAELGGRRAGPRRSAASVREREPMPS